MAVICLTPLSAAAHTGSGAPFLLINGQYAKANPLSGAYPDLAQDIAPQTYFAGKPIEFNLDRAQFSATELDWQWGDGTPDSHDSKPSHIFEKPGTHVTTLQAKNNLSPGFITADVVAINVLPNNNYRLPVAKIQVSLPNSPTGKVKFSAATDPNIISYEWRLGDGELGKGPNVSHSYQAGQFSIYPVLKITDKSGFTSEAAFTLTSDGKHLSAQSLPYMPNALTQAVSKKTNPVLPIAIGAGSLLLLSGLIWLGLRQKA